MRIPGSGTAHRLADFLQAVVTYRSAPRLPLVLTPPFPTRGAA
jgi:hypothetical protein